MGILGFVEKPTKQIDLNPFRKSLEKNTISNEGIIQNISHPLLLCTSESPNSITKTLTANTFNGNLGVGSITYNATQNLQILAITPFFTINRPSSSFLHFNVLLVISIYGINSSGTPKIQYATQANLNFQPKPFMLPIVLESGDEILFNLGSSSYSNADAVNDAVLTLNCYFNFKII